jgi:hypothetical protein
MPNLYYACGVGIKHIDEVRFRIFSLSLSMEDTVEFIANNTTDINEAGYYPYAVLIREELPDVYFSNCVEQQWYKFDGKIRKYVECKKPKRLENYIFNGMEISQRVV